MYQKFDGKKFYKVNSGTGYYKGTGGIWMHRYVYAYYNGEIPEGYHVHHIDGNPDNNDISNLELLSMHDHLSQHMTEKRKECARQNLDEKARPKACEWHKSEAGKEWHKKHFEDCSREVLFKPATEICKICGKEYQTVSSQIGKSKYCSNNCRAAARRRSGKDNEQRPCAVCGKLFTCNKYLSTKTCSSECCKKYKQINKELHHQTDLENQ